MLRLFDTNVLISLRDGDSGITDQYAELTERPAMSIVSKVELDNGVFRDSGQAAIRLVALDILLEDIDILPFNLPISSVYRAIISVVGFNRGRTLDRMIAATAITMQATLVTANIRDFRDIPGLKIEDWSN